MPLGEEVPIEQGHQRGVPPLTSRYFTTIGSSSVKWLQIDTDLRLIIASTADFPVVPALMTLNDLEPQK